MSTDSSRSQDESYLQVVWKYPLTLLPFCLQVFFFAHVLLGRSPDFGMRNMWFE